MSYEDIYALTPVREVEPDWWKLRWRPLWGKTFSIYKSYGKCLGIMLSRNDVRNGWGRSYKRADLRIGLVVWSFDAWLHWDYVVHKDGPFDVAESDRKPLAIPARKKETE